MAIALQSDFRDYYDQWFSSSTEPVEWTWDRKSRNSMRKRDQFQLMEALGFKTPKHGIAWDFLIHEFLGSSDRYEPSVVVYLDELAHGGQGKILTTPVAAVTTYPTHYASRYYSTADQGAISTRFLVIGDRGWVLTYRSHDSWQSNCGSVEISLDGPLPEGEFDRNHKLLEFYPAFSIDLVVPNGSTDALAIAFNTTPKVEGTPVADILSSQNCFGLVRDWMESHAVMR